MHGYAIHKDFYLNWKIHAPGPRVQDPWVGQIAPHSVNVLNLIPFSFVLSFL